MEGKKLDFQLLRKRIKSMYKTFGLFADRMEISHQKMSRLLTGKTDWSISEVAKAAELLKIESEIVTYFFTQKSPKQEKEADND